MVRTSLALLIVAALGGSPVLAASTGSSAGGGHGGSGGAHGAHAVSATGASHGHHMHGGTGMHHHHQGANTHANRNFTASAEPFRDCQPGAVQYLQHRTFCAAPVKVQADGKAG